MSATELVSTTEQEDFARLDGVVRRGLATFVEIGEALREIRDRKLYRIGFGTFEAYMSHEHGLSRQRGYHLIDAAAVTSELSTIVDKTPQNEAQCRELLAYDDADRQEVWQQVVEESERTGKPITARLINEVGKPYREPLPAEQFESGSSETLDILVERETEFATFYADPPWQYDNQATRAATDNHYPTMAIADICSLPVGQLAADKALLFLWTTNGFLEAALTQVIPAWGFTFKSSMVWVKPQMGIGNYVRNAHEFLLIANRGGLIPNGKSQISWVEADRTRHSAKPDAFRHVVESIAPGPRLEMFAREAMPGWHAWGNQVSKSQLLDFAEAK